MFRAPVLAGGDSYTLRFSAGALALPVVRTSADFTPFFAVFPCGVFEFTGSGLPEQVLALLHASVRQGAGLPNQQALARSLDIPLSTFRRRLASEGASYRQLREECLRLSAQELLHKDALSINAIAAQLGFSDAPAFRRVPTVAWGVTQCLAKGRDAVLIKSASACVGLPSPVRRAPD
ncbi:MAG: helix-turn-helix domain-containing protein [Halioglobus sp.]